MYEMIQGKWFAPGESLDAVLPVRLAVFGRAEDALDAESWNAMILMDGSPVATGRIWWKEDAFWLGDIGVLPEYRGRRLGDLALRLLLFKAQSHSAREVRLSCPPGLTGFFARLGLREEPGGTPDVVPMSIPGDRIDLDSCRHCPKQSCPNRKP